MFRDNSLLPKETIRLAALGILNEKPRTYYELATVIREFVGLIASQSIELTGPSIELLRYEGLICSQDQHESKILSLTNAGCTELKKLLKANVRPTYSNNSKLVFALKMRFLHILSKTEKELQLDLLIDTCEIELVRLTRLTDSSSHQKYFQDWLSHDTLLVQSRLTWLKNLRKNL